MTKTICEKIDYIGLGYAVGGKCFILHFLFFSEFFFFGGFLICLFIKTTANFVGVFRAVIPL